MDTQTDAWRRFHGRHVGTTARRDLPETLQEIESAIMEFRFAADDLVKEFSRLSAERAWVCSRVAWSLMFPYRRPVLRTNPALIETFRTAVRRAREALEPDKYAQDDFFEYLGRDFSRRESLLDALLSDDSENRICALLAAERQAVERS